MLPELAPRFFGLDFVYRLCPYRADWMTWCTLDGRKGRTRNSSRPTESVVIQMRHVKLVLHDCGQSWQESLLIVLLCTRIWAAWKRTWFQVNCGGKNALWNLVIGRGAARILSTWELPFREFARKGRWLIGDVESSSIEGARWHLTALLMMWSKPHI